MAAYVKDQGTRFPQTGQASLIHGYIPRVAYYRMDSLLFALSLAMLVDGKVLFLVCPGGDTL
jgi:hypothetical protein